MWIYGVKSSTNNLQDYFQQENSHVKLNAVLVVYVMNVHDVLQGKVTSTLLTHTVKVKDI